MTDEEKAEEIARRISKPCLHIVCIQYCSMVKQAYLDGLAEGRISTVEKYSQVDRATITSIETLEKEIAGLKNNLVRYSQKIAEQEETIDAQDDKINFYVAKMNENILKRQELEKENTELKAQIESLNGEIRVLIGANQQLNSMFKVKDECAREYIEQIEKMKCCGNCKHYNYCPMQSNKECQNDKNILKYKWELAETKEIK